MAAGQYSFVIEQGATLNLNVVWTDSNDTPVDVSGWNGRMQIRPTVESDVIYISLSSSLQPDGTGIDLSGANSNLESGSFYIHVSAYSSSLLNFDSGYYDLELEKDNVVVRLLEGRVKLSKNVTR